MQTIGAALAAEAAKARDVITLALQRLQHALTLAELASDPPDAPGGTPYVWHAMRTLGLCEQTLSSVADALTARPQAASDPCLLLSEAWEIETGPGFGVGPDILAAMTPAHSGAAIDRAKVEAAAAN